MEWRGERGAGWLRRRLRLRLPSGPIGKDGRWRVWRLWGRALRERSEGGVSAEIRSSGEKKETYDQQRR